jgi:hypothetical protein
MQVFANRLFRLLVVVVSFVHTDGNCVGLSGNIQLQINVIVFNIRLH